MPYRIAFIDIETSPNLGYVWGKWQQNVLHFEASWYILSFSVKWAGCKPVTYALPDFPLYRKRPDSDRDLVKALWKVLDEADLVVAHNGDKFDIKKSNARFIFHGMNPPSPYKTVDTLKLARKHFGFTSNKLDDICKYLDIGSKVRTGGFSLWLDVMKGDLKAWARMKKYNAHDVVLLEQVYDRFRGWHTTHPNVNVNNADNATARCPACGSKRLQKRGWRPIRAYRARSYFCLHCGKFSQGEHQKIEGVLLR